MEINFVAHLHRQMTFLERSCASYDAGHLDEAIRIATVLRVLLHNTKTSTSLLKHLNATTINLLSTTIDAPAGAVWMVGLGAMQIGGEQSSYFPHFGSGPISDLIPVSKWWSQVVMVVQDRRISRKHIVLGAANRDGGAHVDTSLTPEYEALAAEGAVGTFGYGEASGAEIQEPIKHAHLVSLRQLGYEVLRSPDIQKLMRQR